MPEDYPNKPGSGLDALAKANKAAAKQTMMDKRTARSSEKASASEMHTASAAKKKQNAKDRALERALNQAKD